MTKPMPHRWLTRRTVLAATACLSTGLGVLTAHAAPEEERLRRIVDAAVQPVIQEHHLPGLAVALTIDGRPYFFNYGVANKETRTPVSERTLFEIGSVSKTFTATLAAYGLVQGKFSLNDHPGRYVPALQGRPIDQATLLQLATYTAGGLPLQFPDEVNSATLVRWFQDWRPVAAPGSQRLYSNPSIGLFGHVAALAMKRDFAEMMDADVLPALGLRHTYAKVPAAAMADYAWGYVEGSNGDTPVRVRADVLDTEAYGIRTTTADLIRFVQLQIDPSGLAAPWRQAVAATHVGHFRVGPMVQGLGWEQYPYPVPLDTLLQGNSTNLSLKLNPAQAVDDARGEAIPGARLFNKTGATRGFGAYAAFIPARHLGIVLLANRSYPNSDKIRAAAAILEQVARQAQ